MLTNLDPESALFLADVNRIEKRISDANSQVSSGKKITAASDAPDQIDSLLQLRADRQHNTQVQSNLSLATTGANTADDALASAIKLMDTAVTLAAQAANDTIGAASRQSIALQVQGILQQMVAYSQTTVQGSYVFSGDQDNGAAYSYDTTLESDPTGTPVVQLISNPSATRRIEDPSGGSFAAAKTAQEIFDDTDPNTGQPAADNVFAALNTLRQALQNNDTAGVANAVSLLEAASGHLNSMESFYGNVQTRIQNASSFASSYDVQLQTETSQIEDADVTSAALEFTQANTQLQAAFQMRAQKPQKSLFDYLG